MYCKKCDVCGEIYDFQDSDLQTPDDYEAKTHGRVTLFLKGQDTKQDEYDGFTIKSEDWDLCPKCMLRIHAQLLRMKGKEESNGEL